MNTQIVDQDAVAKFLAPVPTLTEDQIRKVLVRFAQMIARGERANGVSMATMKETHQQLQTILAAR